MFTAEEIKAAHSKVKSGADFPSYIREIKAMGVTHYECYVTDGHIDYHGSNHSAHVTAKYDALPIADEVNTEQFKSDLKAHQRGETDFLTFIEMCARFGIEKWIVSMGEMTCTYYDKDGNKILEEVIPG